MNTKEVYLALCSFYLYPDAVINPSSPLFLCLSLSLIMAEVLAQNSHAGNVFNSSLTDILPCHVMSRSVLLRVVFTSELVIPAAVPLLFGHKDVSSAIFCHSCCFFSLKQHDSTTKINKMIWYSHKRMNLLPEVVTAASKRLSQKGSEGGLQGWRSHHPVDLFKIRVFAISETSLGTLNWI